CRVGFVSTITMSMKASWIGPGDFTRIRPWTLTRRTTHFRGTFFGKETEMPCHCLGETLFEVELRNPMGYYCVGNKAYYSLKEFRGSRFPSHKVWIDGVLKKTIEQQYVSDLWESHQGDPVFVK
ncbi:MAG: hypothetical protein ACKVKK_04825, partial [Flavobacteriales bacterium]